MSKTQMALVREEAAAMITREPTTGFFLLGEEPGYQVCCWEPSCGLMAMVIEADLVDGACVAHLLERAAPRFGSDAEALAYAEAHGWPRSKPLGSSTGEEATGDFEPPAST